MAGLLTDFLRRAADEPFVWGERDCCLWPCEWIAIRYGRDPAEKLRGSYSSAVECWSRMREEGGLVEVARRIAADCGFVETDAPDVGDLGLCHLKPHKALTGYSLGICLGARFAFKAPSGVTIAPAKPVIAWRF